MGYPLSFNHGLHPLWRLKSPPINHEIERSHIISCSYLLSTPMTLPTLHEAWKTSQQKGTDCQITPMDGTSAFISLIHINHAGTSISGPYEVKGLAEPTFVRAQLCPIYLHIFWEWPARSRMAVPGRWKYYRFFIRELETARGSVKEHAQAETAAEDENQHSDIGQQYPQRAKNRMPGRPQNFVNVMWEMLRIHIFIHEDIELVCKTDGFQH